MSNMNINKTKAYDEGYDAGFNYTNRNPYPKGSFEFKEYESGFDYAIGVLGDDYEANYSDE